jgi:hypothetical protein
LKEEALDRTLWRTRFGRGYGLVVRQTAEWMNELIRPPKRRTVDGEVKYARWFPLCVCCFILLKHHLTDFNHPKALLLTTFIVWLSLPAFLSTKCTCDCRGCRMLLKGLAFVVEVQKFLAFYLTRMSYFCVQRSQPLFLVLSHKISVNIHQPFGIILVLGVFISFFLK